MGSAIPKTICSHGCIVLTVNNHTHRLLLHPRRSLNFRDCGRRLQPRLQSMLSRDCGRRFKPRLRWTAHLLPLPLPLPLDLLCCELLLGVDVPSQRHVWNVCLHQNAKFTGFILTLPRFRINADPSSFKFQQGSHSRPIISSQMSDPSSQSSGSHVLSRGQLMRL